MSMDDPDRYNWEHYSTAQQGNDCRYAQHNKGWVHLVIQPCPVASGHAPLLQYKGLFSMIDWSRSLPSTLRITQWVWNTQLTQNLYLTAPLTPAVISQLNTSTEPPVQLSTLRVEARFHNIEGVDFGLDGYELNYTMVLFLKCKVVETMAAVVDDTYGWLTM